MSSSKLFSNEVMWWSFHQNMLCVRKSNDVEERATNVEIPEVMQQCILLLPARCPLCVTACVRHMSV